MKKCKNINTGEICDYFIVGIDDYPEWYNGKHFSDESGTILVRSKDNDEITSYRTFEYFSQDMFDIKEESKKEILLNEVVFKFEQGPDDCGPNEDQFLDVEVVDGGAGKYFVLKTERWAIDSVDELKTLFEKISKVIDQF